MRRDDVLGRMFESKLVAVLRSSDADLLASAAKALVDGGISVLEVTFTVPGALGVLGHLREELGERAILGAGTVLDPETARAAILAGAEFIVGPTLRREVVGLCRRYATAVLPGAFTPTEILAAWEAGADVVKVFPADVGGPDYLRSIHGPLPQIPLMPTGGIDKTNVAAFLRAGAVCVGLGSALLDKKALAEGNLSAIRAAAEEYVAAVAGR